MAIPTYDQLMLPVLRHTASQVWSMRDLASRIADDLQLNETDRMQQIPSGGASVIASRVGWAKTYLKQAGLVEQPKRGLVSITPRGRELLARGLEKIDIDTLEQFEEFRNFIGRARPSSGEMPEAGQMTPLQRPTTEPSSTPEEQISSASLLLDEALRDTLLARIREGTPGFFERLIVDLLLAMGYGGSRSDAGEQLGGTGDGGVDGLIREDQLGLDRVYLQAKRYQAGNTVGSEAVQAFIGALIGKGAQKGVFITTSTFSKSALQAANQSGHIRLVLIDGDDLTTLLVRFNVGVRVARTVEIKRIDLDYFEGTEPE